MLRLTPHGRSHPVPRDRRRRTAGPRSVPPWVVLASSLALTVLLVWLTVETALTRDRVRFDRAAVEARHVVSGRFDVYVALLRGTAGLVGLQPELSRADFERYVDRLRVRESYPGIQGVGLTVRVAPAGVSALERRMRAQGLAGFRVTPDSARPEYHAIVYLAPLDERNRAVVGFDMFTEPVRREAMERARDGAEPAMSGRVTLLQEISGPRQAGFLVYVPVYRGNDVPASVEARREALLGFAYAPFRADDLFSGIFGASQAPDVDIQVFSGATPAAENLLHDSRAAPARIPSRFAGLSDTLRLDVAGRPLTMVVTAAPAFGEGRRAALAPIVALLGILVSLVLYALARARRRAVLAVADARDLFGRVLEQAPVAISVFRGPNHVFEVANPSYRRLVPTDPIGRALRDVLPDGEPQRFVTTLDQVYASGTPWVGHGLQLAYEKSDAPRAPQYFNVLYYPFTRRDGATDGVIAVAVDVTAEVTARRDAELARQEAEQANRAKSDFLAAMSHELRTPLNAIAGYVQLVQLGVHGPVNAQQQEALARVQRSAGHLLSLINDVLNFAKLEAGRVEFSIRDIDLRDAVTDVIHMVEPQLEARQLTCQVDVAPGLRVLADPEKVRQILLNLLSNAVKFTEEGGIRIHVGTSTAEPGMVRLHVTDTGIGIPAERQAAVFDPFIQVNRGLTQTTEGTGLGLAISRDLAHGMGAELTVESEVGKGSTFTLALPAMRDEG